MGTHLKDRAAAIALTPPLLAFVASARMRERPHPAYAALRRVDPVHRSPFGFWVVTGHAEVSAVLRDPRYGTDERAHDTSHLRIGPVTRLLGRQDMGAHDGRSDEGERTEEAGAFFELAPNLMLFRDPPDHTRLRRLVNRAFTPRRVAALEATVAALTDELLAPLAPARGGGPRRFDVMDAFAYPLPAQVICELVGLPSTDHELIAAHGRDLAVGLDPLPSAEELARADRAVVGLRAHLEEPIGQRRDAPRDDLLSDLVAVADDGDRLTADELVATVVLLLIAGHETTANLIGNALVSLDDDPAARTALAEDPSVVETGIEELLRLDPPVQITQRFPGEDVELGGHAVPAGSLVILGLAAANRDPAVFADPHRINVARDPNPHLAFGAGAHHCVGAALARMEARIALPALLRALPDARVARPRPRRRSSLTIRGFRHLWLERP